MKKTSRFMLYMLAACLFSATAAGETVAGQTGERQTIRIAYTDWASSVASANLIRGVFQEKLDMRCELVMMSVDRMWEAVAKGEVDAMLSAWLPDTHAHYKEAFGEKVVDLGPNLEGARTGLVVPDVKLGRLAAGAGIRKSYITIDSIAEIKDHAGKFNHRIIGIEPEAGIMRQTEDAMEAYGLEDFELVKGSEKEMTDVLSRAIRRQEWIVITGWTPHWSFARWNLRFLEDPKNIYGDKGYIHTLVREGLSEDMPEAFALLDNFQWEPEALGQVMLWIQEDDGRFPYDKALRWIRANPEKVDTWLTGN